MDIWKLLKKVTVQYQKNLASISFIEPNAIESTEIESILDDPELIGILFQITVHPLISSTVFADIREFSQYPGEEEILFSMHSIFRIEHIEQINNNDRLWQVNLTLTTDNDRELNVLTEFIRKETFPKQKGWYRMGQLLIKFGKFNMAEDVFKTLLGQTTDKRETALINYQLIGIYNAQGNYIEAIRCYEKAYELFQSIYTANHPILSFTYAAVGFVNTIEDMKNFIRNSILILLIVSVILSTTSAGPNAYAGCMTTCMGVSGAFLTIPCAVLCAPTLLAPTP
ncbi:hypothetical protein I4U23_011432 [Adineta vaga]|nr:hypothetical protein I4U23_011432 [Adineta vaga]